jgi:hypothetical protein
LKNPVAAGLNIAVFADHFRVAYHPFVSFELRFALDACMRVSLCNTVSRIPSAGGKDGENADGSTVNNLVARNSFDCMMSPRVHGTEQQELEQRPCRFASHSISKENLPRTYFFICSYFLRF